MVFALLGYFGTMVTVLAGLMMLCNVVFTDLPQPLKQRPHLRPAVVEVEQQQQPIDKAGASAVQGTTDVAKSPTPQDAHSLAAAQSDAEKNRRLKTAQAKRRRMLARRQEEPSYTAALGYEQEPYSPVFGPFGSRRF